MVFTSNLLCLYKGTRASRILTDHITCFSIVKKKIPIIKRNFKKSVVWIPPPLPALK